MDRQKNIEFLKNEYGTGGGTHIFPDGFSGHSWYDSKGLAIDRNGTYTNHDLVLKWSQVEKRLRELIMITAISIRKKRPLCRLSGERVSPSI